MSTIDRIHNKSFQQSRGRLREDELAPSPSRRAKPQLLVNDNNLLNIYFRAVEKIPVLKQGAIVALAKSGRPQDIKEIVHHNLRLVVSIARKFMFRGSRLLHLLSAGNMGLVLAAHRFDYRRGFNFSTFAFPYIQGYILDEIADRYENAWVPKEVRRLIFRLSEAQARLEQKLGRTLTEAEQAKSISEINDADRAKRKITAEQLEAIKLKMKIESLHDLIGDDNETNVDSQSVEEAVENSRRRERLVLIMKAVLTEIEINVLFHRFYEDKTLQEIGDEYGYTRSRIQQIEKHALGKLQAGPFGEKLKELIA